MMESKPFQTRRSPRIPKFNYSNRYSYFVTFCTHDHQCLFWTNGRLNELGIIADQDMKMLPLHYQNIQVDTYVIMPNHIHAIITIENSDNNPSLDKIIGLYKSGVSRKVKMVSPNMLIWQRSFHDHVIRNEESYEKIWNYIQNNPEKWKEDCFYR